MIQITCYGVRNQEKELFEKFNDHHFNLILVEENLNHKNIIKAKGSSGIIVRSACLLDEINLKKLVEYNIKYIITRTAGTNHIQLDYAKKLPLKIANLPAYSPESIAELVIGLALTLKRHLASIFKATSNNDFRLSNSYLGDSLSSLKVGIIGAGHIGLACAKLFKAFGSKVFFLDAHIKDDMRDQLYLLNEEDFFTSCDIISIHIPYRTSNYHFINADKLSLMKENAILINTSRGEIVDTEALLTALENNHIQGAALDVIENEKELFHNRDLKLAKRLENLYPRLLITPHIGSFTNKAMESMISQSLKLMNDLIIKNQCENLILDD